MAEMITVSLHINGNSYTVVTPEDRCLLRYLRDDLGLMGTKDGCTSGHCGACTVIINGKATRSCLVKMSRLDGAVIETIEGLSHHGRLHPLQEEFIEHGAAQCGFCTPGMIMTAKALLDENPNPSPQEIKEAFAKNRNLCRCTGYVKIIQAVQAAARRLKAKQDRQAASPDSFLRRQVAAKVTGKLQYGADMVLEGMLHGKVLWSQHPHAEILSIDTTEAEAFPGVERVITAKDIPGKNQAGILIRDQPAIAANRVLYIGDGVAAVFAKSEEIAEAALEKIRVEYRPLPGVFSPEEASRPGAPILHEKGNLLHKAEILRGSVDEAFGRCAAVTEGIYTTPFIEHGFLEPESGVGVPDEDGGVTVYIGTQCVFDDRTQLSEILGLPEEKVRVVSIPQGGSFGGKEDLILQQYLALGALLSQRPVKMVLSRKESLRTHPKRHPARIKYRIGADASGKLMALEADVLIDTGAYASLGPDILENMVVFAAGPYYVPNLKIHGEAWYTNNILAGAMRGFGVNQMAFALEGQLDTLARKLGIDPFEFRHLNALDVGLPLASDHVMEKGIVAIKDTILAARQAYQKIELPKARPGCKIGVGVASAVKNVGFGHGIPESAGAVATLASTGMVTISASQHEYGQGAQAGLVRLAAIELGIQAEKIEIIRPNTALTPETGPTTASRQTFLTGNAVVEACRALRAELFNRAAEELNASPARLKLQGSRVVDNETGAAIELSTLGENISVQKRYTAPDTAPMLEGENSRFGKPGFETRPTHWCYIFSTQVAIVEVDEESGAVDVLKVIAAVDVGKALNPQVIEGQIEGGVMMGLGYALSEEFIIEEGINKTNSLHLCRLPGADMTPEITPVIVEVPHPFGPNGAKGFAEGPSLATAPAIINAIYDAVGVRIQSLPADRKKVKAALESQKAGK